MEMGWQTWVREQFGSSSATRGAWPSAPAKLSAATLPASRVDAKSLSVKLLISMASAFAT